MRTIYLWQKYGIEIKYIMGDIPLCAVRQLVLDLFYHHDGDDGDINFRNYFISGQVKFWLERDNIGNRKGAGERRGEGPRGKSKPVPLCHIFGLPLPHLPTQQFNWSTLISLMLLPILSSHVWSITWDTGAWDIAEIFNGWWTKDRQCIFSFTRIYFTT